MKKPSAKTETVDATGMQKPYKYPRAMFRNDEPGSPITEIERENADTPDGSRYEVWVPIRIIDEMPTNKT